MDDDVLRTLLLQAIENLSDNLCYPEAPRQVIKTYDVGKVSPHLMTEVKTFFTKLESKGDAEQFLKNFYPKIVLQADTFFLEIGKPYSTLMAKKLGDKLLALYRQPEDLEVHSVSVQESLEVYSTYPVMLLVNY